MITGQFLSAFGEKYHPVMIRMLLLCCSKQNKRRVFCALLVAERMCREDMQSVTERHIVATVLKKERNEIARKFFRSLVFEQEIQFSLKIARKVLHFHSALSETNDGSSSLIKLFLLQLSSHWWRLFDFGNDDRVGVVVV
jgi:hypothetical protein